MAYALLGLQRSSNSRFCSWCGNSNRQAASIMSRSPDLPLDAV